MLCAAREEWDEADAIYDEVLREFPDDSEAIKGKESLHRKMEKADRELHRQEEKEHRHEEKVKAREEKRKAHKRSELLFSKRFVVAAVLVFVLVCAAVAAVFGITAHRNKINELYSQKEAAVTHICVITEKTDAL